MKFLKINIILTILTCWTNLVHPQWQQTNGPHGGQIYCLTTSGTELYAGTHAMCGKVFRSTNNGANWSLLASLSTDYVYSIAVDGDTIYAGTHHGIFISYDHGSTWINSNSGIPNTMVYAIVKCGTTVFAGTHYDGVFISVNNGVNWSATSLSSIQIRSFAVRGTTVYAGSYNGVYSSDDFGFSWQPLNTGLPIAIFSLAVDSSNIFVGTAGGVYMSPNNGATWTQLVNTGVYSYVRSLLISGTHIYAGLENGGIYFSANYGLSWSQINTGLLNTYVFALTSIGNNLFVGTQGGGVFTSVNGGTSWSAVNAGLIDTYVCGLAECDTGLLAGALGGVSLTTDNGDNWSVMNNGLPMGSHILSFAKIGTNIFTGIHGRGVYLSTDNGMNWIARNNGFDDIYVHGLAAKGTTLFAGTADGIYKSVDSGATWSLLSAALYHTYSILIYGDYIFAGTGHGIYVSNDNGQSWVSSYNGLSSSIIVSFAVIGTTIFAGTLTGVSITSDTGASWNSSGLPFTDFIHSMATYDSAIYVGTSIHGVYMSKDLGITWNNVNMGLSDYYIESLAILNPHTEPCIYAGTGSSGVWKCPLYLLTSTDEIKLTNDMLIYPNPAKDYFSIECLQNSLLEIFNLQGQCMRKQLIYQGKTNINISMMEKGIYILKLSNKDKSELKKLVKD